MSKLWHSGGSCTQLPLPICLRAKFGVLEQTCGVRLWAKFRFDRFILSQCNGGKPKILPFFGLRHFVVSPVCASFRNLNAGEQLKTFPYPKVSKPFLYSNSFMAKSYSETPSFKSVTDTQTDKNSMFLADPAAGEVQSPPNSARW